MTKEDKIKEVENSIKMCEKDIEDCKDSLSKELLGKELDEKNYILKELESLTDEEFDCYMFYKLPLNKVIIKNELEKNKRKKHEMVDIPESHVHIGLSNKDKAYINDAVLDERLTERDYDSNVVDGNSADNSERNFTEGELRCLNNAKGFLKIAIDEIINERKNEKLSQTEKEKVKKVIDEENRIKKETNKIKKLHGVKSIEDFNELYSINEPFTYLYLCTIPKYFEVEENEIMNISFNRERQEISISFRESVGKYQVIKFVNRLNENKKRQCFFNKMFSKKEENKNDEIIVRHISKNGDVEYTEVFNNVVLKGFCEDSLSYDTESYRTLHAVFGYKDVKFYKKFDIYETNGIFDVKDIEKIFKTYSEEKLNQIIENSDIEQNVELAKNELERRKKEIVSKKKKADDYANMVKDWIKYTEKVTGESATIHRLNKEDGTTKEEDNKENL